MSDKKNDPRQELADAAELRKRAEERAEAMKLIFLSRGHDRVPRGVKRHHRAEIVCGTYPKSKTFASRQTASRSSQSG
ncbi:MAG: hypothetical protein ABR542_10585 [Desulfonatronovibrio sp.]